MDSPVEKIKERLPITEVAASYVKLEKAGKSLKARCPFHKERTASFFISPERGTFYCFGCGEKGDIFTLTERLEGVDFTGALRLLAERAGIPLSELKMQGGQGRKEEKDRLYALMEEATNLFQKNLVARPDVREYLKGRGLTEESIKNWRLGYTTPQWRYLSEKLGTYGDADLVAGGLSIRSDKKEVGIYDRFRGRIMFPIADSAGRIIAFSGRYFEKTEGSTEEKEPAKYVNSPETALFRKSFVLHGLDRAKGSIRTSDFSILVEGQMDLLMSHQSGFPNTVALSGTALTDYHLKSLSYLSKRLVLALDCDEAGLRSTLRSAGLALAQGFDVKAAEFPKGMDPADVAKEGKEAYRKTIRESKPVIEFVLIRLREKAKDIRGLRKSAEVHVLPLIASLPSAIDRAHFVETVARVLEVPREAVGVDVRKISSQEVSVREKKEEVPSAFAPALSTLERLVGMVLALAPANESLRVRLTELVDVAPYEKKLLEYRERFLFELESEDSREDMGEELLRLIEREMIEEEIRSARRELASSEASRNEERATELLARLQTLARSRDKLNP